MVEQWQCTLIKRSTHASCVSRSTLCFTQWQHTTSGVNNSSCQCLEKKLTVDGDRDIYW